MFQASEPARVTVGSVTFEPGAPTNWHTQTLVVTVGVGRGQRRDGPVEDIRPGDVVWIAPGEKHWHSAAPSTSMTHIAIQERQDGSVGAGAG
jgi:quercetin dioxygenase-like cupin family protein